MKKLWDNFQVVGYVNKSEGSRYEISCCTKDGFRYIRAAEMYKTKTTNEWRFARGGFSLPVKVSCNGGKTWEEPAAKMLSLLTEALDGAIKMDLSDEDHAVYIEERSKK